jgi:predicted MFS family arabinose efflux permease
VGILVSGLVSPFLLEWIGPGSWWLVWSVLSAISFLMALILAQPRVEELAAQTSELQADVKISPILSYLIGYFLFGAGYIAYMTFMIAYIRAAGGEAIAQSAFWTSLGLGALAQPWVWRRSLAAIKSGSITALLTLITAVGAMIPLVGQSPALLVASALIFGNAFFAVVSSTTAFARYNHPRGAWPKVIATMTVAFSIGQSLGPIAIGAITDKMGSLSFALTVSAAILVMSAMAFLRQGVLRHGSVVKGVEFR